MRTVDSFEPSGGGNSRVTDVALSIASKQHLTDGCRSSVIELGTAYGSHLSMLSQADYCIDRWTSVDVMYDWVPDVRPDEAFDPTRVDLGKVLAWLQNSRVIRFEHHLLVGRTHDMASDENAPILLGSNILIVDACHHPPPAVVADYWDYHGFLTPEHFAVFDDIDHGDPKVAMGEVEGQLRDLGYTVERRDLVTVGVLHVVSPAGLEPASVA